MAMDDAAAVDHQNKCSWTGHGSERQTEPWRDQLRKSKPKSQGCDDERYDKLHAR